MLLQRRIQPYLFFLLLLLIIQPGSAADSERLHLLIPGGAGGGWDTTARGVGEALSRAGLVDSTSYENISGGGGSKAIAYLIETAFRQGNTLMVSSSPFILKSLKGVFPQSYKDLTPIAAVIADYGAFVVKVDSPLKSWGDVVASYKKDPRSVKFAGGSVRGSMDHLVAAMAINQSNADPKVLRYIPYNAGAKAMVGLLSGETQILSTGLSEAFALVEQGEVRILAITADKRVDYAPELPTLTEQGVDAVFKNWRGFFGAPGLDKSKQVHYQQLLADMYETQAWESVRKSRGWTNFFLPGKSFVTFLGEQEKELEKIMIELSMK